MRRKYPKYGEAGYRHPYMEYEESSLWPLVEKGISDLVNNQDLIEKEDRNYIVGYLCKVVSEGQKKARRTSPSKVS